MYYRNFFMVCLALPLVIWAADPPDPTTKALTSMEESIAAQRASVARQTGHYPAKGFFILPRISEVPMLPAAPSDCPPVSPLQLDSIIQGAAEANDIRPEILRQVIKYESAFEPCAVSPKGAMGLMQLMPATVSQFDVKNPFDPKENVNAGAKLLKQLLAVLQDFPLALGAYNAGLGRVTRTGGIPDIPETRSYIRNILSGLPPDLLLPTKSK